VVVVCVGLLVGVSLRLQETWLAWVVGSRLGCLGWWRSLMVVNLVYMMFWTVALVLYCPVMVRMSQGRRGML
jgi:hypothetical protein